jgi:pimeloyl-ACP methyl ester carboxylesterase
VGLLAISPASIAQETTATIIGAVTRRSGGVFPGVTVTLRHLGTKQTFERVTTAEGLHTAPPLPIGEYEITFALAGFRPRVIRGVTPSVKDRIAVDARLPVAAAALFAAQAEVRTGKTKTGIAYDVQGKGPVVVLITGSNLDRRMWTREEEWLAPDHTVIRYDLRAHGQSDTATNAFSHLDDLLELLDELSISKAAFVGLSAGSTIALDLGLQAPERVERLVLAGPAISGYVPKERPAFVGDLTAALQARDFKKAGEVLLATPTFAAPPESQALVRQMVMENDRLWTVPRALMRMPAKPAVDRLGEVRVPTLVLIGEKDTAQREQADMLAARVPGARLVVVPGGGHLLNLTSPAEFRAAVSAFLR